MGTNNIPPRLLSGNNASPYVISTSVKKRADGSFWLFIFKVNYSVYEKIQRALFAARQCIAW